MSHFLEAALRYAAMGWRVFPLGVASKAPMIPKSQGGNGCLDATHELAQINKWWAEYPKANVGLATGYDFWVLDVDPRHNGDETLQALEHKHGRLPDTIQQITGTGGRHYLFANPGFVVQGRVPIRPDLQGLDTRGANNYILAAPSIHDVTRTAYEWDGAVEIEQQKVLPAPDWLIQIIREEQSGKRTAGAPATGAELIPHGTQHSRLVSMAGTMRNIGMSADAIYKALSDVNAKQCEQPGPDKNIRKIADSAGKWEPGDISGGMKRKLIEEVRRESAAETALETTPDGEPAGLAAPKLDLNYTERLVRTINDQIKPLLANAKTVLESAPDWHNAFCFDEFGHSVHATRSLCDGYIKPMQKIDEYETSLITAETQIKNFLCCGTPMVSEAIQTVARYSSSHPVRNYLAGLVWDGEPRVDTWVTRYLGVEPSNYAAAVGRRWLISAVARVMEPGCQADACIVLEGYQGLGKSTAIKGLCGPDWFCDDVEDLADKDTKLKLRGKWIIELGELSALSRGEINQTKQFMSRAVDMYRAPYGRTTQNYPRQCVFFGTTNQEVYLRDETGNRRFWPLRCNPVSGYLLDVTGLAADRDQIWSEAYLLYGEGAEWHLRDKALLREAEEHQSERVETDPWHSTIEQYAASMLDCSVEEILRNCIGKPVDNWTQGDKNRVGRCLKLSGYERYRSNRAGSRDWRYRPVESEQ